jgi:hypothetical protein
LHIKKTIKEMVFFIKISLINVFTEMPVVTNPVVMRISDDHKRNGICAETTFETMETSSNYLKKNRQRKCESGYVHRVLSHGLYILNSRPMLI